MTLTWGMLAAVIFGAFIGWFWHDSLGVRQLANRAAMAACEQLQLQFLDGTVAFARLWPARGPSGRLTLRRTYVFDYTADSVARRQGFVVLLGSRVESVGFAQETSTTANVPSGGVTVRQGEPSAPPTWGNVYDLDSWRRDPRRLPPAAEADRKQGDA